MTNKAGSLKGTKEYKESKIRSIMYQSFGMNYESMQAPGFVWNMAPILNKLYGDKPEVLRDKNREYFKFYNTNPLLNPMIAGFTASVEETGIENCTESALAMRTGLMGPFAGLGDSLFFITGRTVFGSIAGYMAIKGSPVGLFICMLLWVALWFLRCWFYDVGYTQGTSFITERTNELRALTNAAIIIGLAVVGAMIPSMVSFTTKLTFQMQDASATLDGFLNTILPSFLPVLITFLIYKGLGTKTFTTTKMIWTVIVVCILLSIVGIA